MMSFETFTDLMILLFWSMVAIGGLIGATVWVRERFAGRLAKRAFTFDSLIMHDSARDIITDSQGIPLEGTSESIQCMHAE